MGGNNSVLCLMDGVELNCTIIRSVTRIMTVGQPYKHSETKLRYF
jgi:hypothetical protein